MAGHRSPGLHRNTFEALKGRDIELTFNLMPQSLGQIYVHLVFSTKDRTPWINDALKPKLHAYLAGALAAIDCPALVVGGMPDHVHLLFRLSRTVTLADVVKESKVESSKWMKDTGQVSEFAWQSGYGAFSVSASQVETVSAYIRNQEEHHKSRTFQDEFRKLLQHFNISYDERYVWD
jgi:REP element-mobilizing transposase RayT